MENNKPKDMKAFTLVWVGQAFSLLGTQMTGFALTIWAFEKTGLATALALVGFFYMVPLLVMSPIAGALVDRSNRKLMMMLSDLASGTATLGIVILYFTGNLEVWHLYISSAIMGTFQTFQWPAYSAAITMIVPKQHYARASALNDLAGNASGIFAPLLAGALIGFIGIGGIMVIDLFTMSFAVIMLLIVHIPQPKATAEGLKSQGSLLQESLYGFRYILERPSLLGLQLVFMIGNFFHNFGMTVTAPLILLRTGNNEMIFAGVQTAGAVGGVMGGLFMGAWGGPKRKTDGVLGGWVISSILGMVVFGLGRELVAWSIGSFFGAFFVPLINSSNQAIWQSKVAPDVQGRVFSIRRLIAWVVSPLATLLAGPAADRLLEPAMQQDGALASQFGWLVGVGPGVGMSLMVIIAGLFGVLVGLSGYAFKAVRNAESLMPDHVIAAEPQGAGADQPAVVAD